MIDCSATIKSAVVSLCFLSLGRLKYLIKPLDVLSLVRLADRHVAHDIHALALHKDISTASSILIWPTRGSYHRGPTGQHNVESSIHRMENRHIIKDNVE
eukprot:scaffold403327_cov19-Prasinocladus_malaysianus.AAC.1